MANKEINITMDMLKNELFNFEDTIDSRIDIKYLLNKKGIKKDFLANNMSIDIRELNAMLDLPLYEWKLYHVMELVKLGVVDIVLPTAPIPKIRCLKLQMEMALLDIMEHLATVKECESIIRSFVLNTDSVLASGILNKRINTKFKNTKELPKITRKR